VAGVAQVYALADPLSSRTASCSFRPRPRPPRHRAPAALRRWLRAGSARPVVARSCPARKRGNRSAAPRCWKWV